MGALKYFLLKVDAQKRILFAPEESIQFHGNTGPFIQYTHARISAILRRSRQLEIPDYDRNLPVEIVLHDSERNLIYLLSQFEDRIREAGNTLTDALGCFIGIKVIKHEGITG